MSDPGPLPKRLYVATGNAHKAREIEQILAPLGWEVRVPDDLPPVVEDGATFRENAIKKAASAAAHLDAPALADDSGICVEVLHGAPGIHSARYAGEGATDTENNAHLIAALEALGVEEPAAAFVCHVVVVRPDGSVMVEAEGRVEGILRWPALGAGGFGYDPLFFHPPSDVRLSELAPEAKNALSHRGQALRQLAERLGHAEGPGR